VLQKAFCDTEHTNEDNLSSPICKLPPETLIEIFAVYCGRHSLSINPMSISVPMLALSQICSLWRNIAISTASLWSSINVDLCSRGKGRGQPHALVELYIARSKSNPLSIWLRTRPCPSERTRVSSSFLGYYLGRTIVGNMYVWICMLPMHSFLSGMQTHKATRHVFHWWKISTCY